jgi:hypothetical protein
MWYGMDLPDPVIRYGLYGIISRVVMISNPEERM